MMDQKSGTTSPRCIALLGPYLSGKTTLLESILARTGAITRQGKVSDGNTLGDASPEARSHGMSVELNIAHTEFLDDEFTFIDCPGSIEFSQEQLPVLSGVDAAVVVCEPDEKKIPALQLILKQLEEKSIPHFLFINKIDKAEGRIRDVLEMLQPASSIPLVLRQIPIWENEIATGFIDLALERAYVYREHAPSEIVDMPDQFSDRRGEARYSMLETLADYDDELMEQLLEDMEPPKDKVFDELTRELKQGQICPVLLGSAENGNGILRLLKALRHEAPDIVRTVNRLGLDAKDDTSVLQVLKTFHTPRGGKLSLARVLAGELKDGTIVYGSKGDDERISGLFKLMGQEPQKIASAAPGDTIALGRLDAVATGETLSTDKGGTQQIRPLEFVPPVYALAISTSHRKDEVKLSSALAKIIEEDPSIALDQNIDTHEMVVWGQGEMHMRVTLERLAGKYGIEAETRPRRMPYKETIRKSIEMRGRHKKQSGGHGQFGDVVVDIKPLPRGSGFEFTDTITGGVVPKQYIPAVHNGIKEYMHQGPLGFPVIDFAVNLKDGSYHAVDSSEQAFKTAGSIAMREGMPKCSPVLLEPVAAVEIFIPSDATAKVNQIVSAKRGQLLGFDARESWPGWDQVHAQLPEAELQSLIIELRSATAGVGTFTFTFDHLAELTGKIAEDVLANVQAA
jgi:elongation factor G